LAKGANAAKDIKATENRDLLLNFNLPYLLKNFPSLIAVRRGTLPLRVIRVKVSAPEEAAFRYSGTACAVKRTGRDGERRTSWGEIPDY
jgi:hypothetical protein